VRSDPTRGRFVTTRWTLVNAASASSDSTAARALEELCQTYWPPLYAYLRRQGNDVDRAQDLTQGFFARLLERRDIQAADPARGRFRSFLLTALKRYVMNEHERAMTIRRGGRRPHLSLDFDEAERSYRLECRADDTPDRLFDRKWAAISLDRAMRRVRDSYDRAGKRALADALLPYLTDSGCLPPYVDAAARLGLTEGAVKVAVHRLRRDFGTALRTEIAQTVLDGTLVDDEVRELIRVVST
jgi:RNA polymerase sigma factor (sigma-70 family)